MGYDGIHHQQYQLVIAMFGCAWKSGIAPLPIGNPWDLHLIRFSDRPKKKISVQIAIWWHNDIMWLKKHRPCLEPSILHAQHATFWSWNLSFCMPCQKWWVYDWVYDWLYHIFPPHPETALLPTWPTLTNSRNRSMFFQPPGIPWDRSWDSGMVRQGPVLRIQNLQIHVLVDGLQGAFVLHASTGNWPWKTEVCHKIADSMLRIWKGLTRNLWTLLHQAVDTQLSTTFHCCGCNHRSPRFPISVSPAQVCLQRATPLFKVRSTVGEGSSSGWA